MNLGANGKYSLCPQGTKMHILGTTSTIIVFKSPSGYRTEMRKYYNFVNIVAAPMFKTKNIVFGCTVALYKLK